VSQYQYYEFTAVDRPLTTRKQAELRRFAMCRRANDADGESVAGVRRT
jgi:hypothetical protein